MTKIDSQHYNHAGYDIFPVWVSPHEEWVIQYLPRLTFPSLRKACLAVDLWRRPFNRKWLCRSGKGWFNIAWLLAINPKNYNGVYGRLTKKRLALRKQLLKR